MALKLDIATADEWHVLKGDHQYGPYTYAEMISMLQNKLVFNFDYVWSNHLATWTPIADLSEFSPERLHALAEKNSSSPVFMMRKHPRASVKMHVHLHDNNRFWNGTAESLSAGGALVLMENPLLIPGDQLMIHFRREKFTDAPFNAKAEILSKKLTKDRIHHNSKIYYALKFLNLPKYGQSQVETWVNNKIK